MELEKRKREDDGEADGKRGKARREEKDDGVKEVAVPSDEEVEEFFAILKRIHVAVEYFKKRNSGRREPAAAAWSPSFEREDFDGVTKDEAECSERTQTDQNAGLDLNSDPFTDVSGSTET
ncbi:hypothetical protein ABFS82_05G032200 [Erythranthe guttata]|uniref:Protein NIM1-INTERACTING 2 n=1 Tax=Erythranthe guttata TaxID=4155 RepID=A0A022QTZ9_ERYGU|nr:PREDICTED: protein NIM1-INTERACTING 2-like [Erythranthe guttata]EYU29970.1 hypothetical protein MIMGU_mgv1a016475mg [Erythranthe guttata]|eukprot:XP_012845944.1 PREDICTED: protein NIM1-INTERACTING 2-like [Erythranthe guttata]